MRRATASGFFLVHSIHLIAWIFFYIGQYKNAGTAKNEKPQTIPKACAVLKI